MADLRSSRHQFRSPPVVETALAIQFAELRNFRTVHFGHFHRTIQDRFPVCEDHPRAEPISEEFPTVPRQLMLQLIQKKHGPERVWFRDNVEGTLLVQLQPDRFSLNWRQATPGGDYPSFMQNADVFLREFQLFQLFCGEQGIGPVTPNLCEVVYINHIIPVADESAVECFGAVFTGLSWEQSGNTLPLPELVALNRVYPISGHKGRLYAEAAIARERQGKDFVLLKMTARVLHGESDNIQDSLQLAHDQVVDGFASLTTNDARSQRWG